MVRRHKYFSVGRVIYAHNKKPNNMEEHLQWNVFLLPLSLLVPFPKSNCYYHLLHIFPEIFYTYTNTHFGLEWHAYLHICTHICIYLSKQNSKHHVINPILLLFSLSYNSIPLSGGSIIYSTGPSYGTFKQINSLFGGGLEKWKQNISKDSVIFTYHSYLLSAHLRV